MFNFEGHNTQNAFGWHGLGGGGGGGSEPSSPEPHARKNAKYRRN